jgi:hypothetical protein
MTKNVEIRNTNEKIDPYHDAVDKISRGFTESLAILNDPKVTGDMNLSQPAVYAHILTTIIINLSQHLGKDTGPLGFHYNLGKIMLHIGEMLREGQDQLFPTTEEVH